MLVLEKLVLGSTSLAHFRQNIFEINFLDVVLIVAEQCLPHCPKGPTAIFIRGQSWLKNYIIFITLQH